MTAQIVTTENLSLIIWQSVPVITTELLAQLYGAEDSNIQDNYRRNADRFIEGKHFFKLEGESLREFKKQLTGFNPVSSGNCITESNVVQIPKHTRNLTLWTERGAARHAKILETEQAWEVFEKLEDTYFKGDRITSAPDYTHPDAIKAMEYRATLARWIASIKDGQMSMTPIAANAFVMTADEMPSMLQHAGITRDQTIAILEACVSKLKRTTEIRH